MPLQNSPFAPKLLTTFKDGYGRDALQRDLMAGLTVAIVALPLSMAIAIASGAPPERGLYCAIIGGFLISLLGGSRHQIGGPAGAFIVLVAATVDRHGIEGMLLATLMSGMMMLGFGVLKLGTIVRRMPQPVIVGFTAAIGVIIFASQIRDLLGLTLTMKEPAALLPKLGVLWPALGNPNLAALALSALTILVILSLRKHRPRWPGLLIAVIIAAGLAQVIPWPVETIGSRFGVIPSGLPAPALPVLDSARMLAVLPDAIAFALLGAIESLLSAIVADKMAARNHRSNTELIAQGVANIGAAIFGGIPATGTIARTATNIRAGAVSPVSGMMHAVYLLAFMLLLAPLLGAIPLAALGGILAVVAYGMIETHEISTILRGRSWDAAILVATFFITVLRDLMEGIAVGMMIVLLRFLFMRMRGKNTG